MAHENVLELATCSDIRPWKQNCSCRYEVPEDMQSSSEPTLIFLRRGANPHHVGWPYKYCSLDGIKQASNIVKNLLSSGRKRAHATQMNTKQMICNQSNLIINEQEIAANYEKYIRARDPFRWRSIHQNLNSLGNSFCSDSNLAGASLCRYNYCTWQVWHETHICCQGMRKICSDDQKMKCDKMIF